MNYLKQLSIMALMVSAVTTAKAGDDEQIITRPSFEVVDGKFTPELVEAFGRVAEPQVSPDKKKILYCVEFISLKADKGNKELWVMDIDGANPTQITKTAEPEFNAVWINGGAKIAFISTVDGKTQLFTMNADGTDRKQISQVENGIGGFRFSPDETKVMFIGSVKYGKTVKDHYPDLDKANAHIVDDLMYKHWDEWVSEIPHPFVADFDGNSLSNIIDVIEGEPFEAPMKPFGGVESLVWAPDSKSIVYVSRKLEGREYAESTNSDLYLYDLATRETTNLTNGMFGYDTNPVFSPKGDKIAWLSMEHDGYESDKNRIFVMDMKSRQKTDLTADWDYTVNDIAWNPDGKSIYFIAHHQGSTPIFSIDVKSHQVTTVADHECDYATIAPVDEHRVVALRHAITYPNEIFMVEAGSATQLSNVNTELLSQLSPVTVEKHMVPTTDGKEMLTWVILPPNFDKTKKYPAILYCQGGPQQAVSQMWSYRWNFRLVASQGYVVIAPNRRGLPGFGTEWNAQISGDYGGQNMKDYLSAVDYMKEKPYIDSEHIGATGASYGGFSVYWLAGNHDNRFAALLAHAGIFNTEAQYLETEEMWFANWDLGGPFWDKSNKIAQRSFENSPHHFVDRWTAPIMITVGERDYRILASQGMQAFNAARLRDIPTRMLVYPEENHWILKPQNALLWQREFFGWFDRWLKPNQE